MPDEKKPAETKPEPEAKTLAIRDCPVCHRSTAHATCPRCGFDLDEG